jgi:hypothetical protein
MPGEKMPMYPRNAPRMREEVEKGRARKPRATAKLKLGPGKACLKSQLEQSLPFVAIKSLTESQR